MRAVAKKRRFLMIPLFVSILCSTACADEQEEGQIQNPEEATALLETIQMENYTTWQRAPGYEERRESDAPHGDMVDIYVNPILAQTLEGGQAVSEWPSGSVIVKDGFKDAKLRFIAVMEKRMTGWYWAEYDGDGNILFSGEPALCTGCHQSGSDFVKGFSFPSESP